MKKCVIESIRDTYGCEPYDLIIVEADQLYDSVQDSICTNCGYIGSGVEPDACNYTCDDCGENKSMSLSMFVMGVI